MINFSLVDVKNITSDVSRSNFSDTDIDNLADLILETGGIIKPLVVKATAPENYIVLEGHFEYYAAVRAKEKNPRKGEMVNAFIISSKVEGLVIRQTSAIKSIEDSDSKINNQDKLESRLTNIELRFEKQINEMKSNSTQEIKNLEEKIKDLEGRLPTNLSPLEVFNSLELPQLTLKLINAGINQITANKVATSIEKERKKKEFTSLNDVVERVKISSGKSQKKGITPAKMVEIIDIWSRR